MKVQEYKEKLLGEILLANSQEDVKRLIKDEIALLEKNKINKQIIEELVNKLIGELDLFSPLKKNAQQWSNIKIAIIQLLRIKKGLKILPPE
jgi:hypothetical protein